jgi:hypothetical protein
LSLFNSSCSIVVSIFLSLISGLKNDIKTIKKIDVINVITRIILKSDIKNIIAIAAIVINPKAVLSPVIKTRTSVKMKIKLSKI